MTKTAYSALVEATMFVAMREDYWEEDETVITSVTLMDETMSEEYDFWRMEEEPAVPFTDCILRKTNAELACSFEWEGEERPKASEMTWEMLDIEESFEEWTTFEVLGNYVVSEKDRLTVAEAADLECAL